MQSIAHILPKTNLQFRHPAEERPFEPTQGEAPVIRFPTPEAWHEYYLEQRRSGLEIPNIAYCKYGCGGTGYFRRDVPLGHPLFGKAVQCQCAKEKAAYTDAQQIAKYRESLSPTEQGWTPDNWVGEDENARAKLKMLLGRGWGMYCFYGAVGVGKTGLLAGAVNWFLDRGERAMYEVVPSMLRKLRATYEDDTFDATWNALLNIKVLALDELYRNKESEWTQERMFELLDYRYRYWDRLLTVVATNAQPNPAEDALWSRFTDTQRGEIVHVTGGDLRPLAKHF